MLLYKIRNGLFAIYFFRSLKIAIVLYKKDWQIFCLDIISLDIITLI